MLIGQSTAPFLILPAAGVMVGGVLGALRTLPKLWQSAVQHFAAGVVFAAIATEIIPDTIHGGSPPAAVSALPSASR
jgi:ZIP family zinc transporter